jgi:hypothetical protein
MVKCGNRDWQQNVGLKQIEMKMKMQDKLEQKQNIIWL